MTQPANRFPTNVRPSLIPVLALVWLLPASVRADERPVVPVIRPEKRGLVDFDEYTGRFEAVGRVEVRARVGGYLEKVAFQEGQLVERGDLLVVIDQEPYRIALEAAEAELAEAVAVRELAKIEQRRAERLLAARTIPEEQYDRAASEQAAASARAVARQAAVDRAALNLEYTEVRAPMSGRVGEQLVDEGNLIAGGDAGATLLTTVVQQDPIYFVFEASEADVLKYTRLDESGARDSSRTTPNAVSVKLLDENEFLHHGVMDFVDNELDPSSGTMEARAVLANPGAFLQPGLFGRLRLQGSGLYEAILVPDHVIQFDQSRQFVFVLDAEGNVGRRFIEPGPLVDDKRIVRKGLTGDDRVIAGGFHRIRVGQPVRATDGRSGAID